LANDPEHENGNGPTDDQVLELIEIIEEEATKLVTEKMEYMRRCKPIHEAIAEIIDEACAVRGFNKKAVKIKLKQRAYARKANDLEMEIDIEVAAALKHYAEALGDFGSLPLGQAAKAGFERDVKKGHPLDGMASR
jgi:hypothetical protein